MTKEKISVISDEHQSGNRSPNEAFREGGQGHADPATPHPISGRKPIFRI